MKPGSLMREAGSRIREGAEVWIELGESRRRAPLIAPTPYPSPASVGGGRRRWQALPPPTLAGEAREIERSDDRTGGGWSGAGAGIPPHPTSANGSRSARRAFVSLSPLGRGGIRRFLLPPVRGPKDGSRQVTRPRAVDRREATRRMRDLRRWRSPPHPPSALPQAPSPTRGEGRATRAIPLSCTI